MGSLLELEASHVWLAVKMATHDQVRNSGQKILLYLTEIYGNVQVLKYKHFNSSSENPSECNELSETLRTSIRQRGAAPSVGAGVAGTALSRCECTARSHIHDVLQHSVGAVGFGVERQLLAIQGDGLNAAAEPVGDGQAAPVAGHGVLAYMATEVNAVVKVKGSQGARCSAWGGVHPIQHKLGVITVHLKWDGVPLPVVNLSAVDWHEAGTTAAVELVLQAAVYNLFQRVKTQSWNMINTRDTSEGYSSHHFCSLFPFLINTALD